MLCKSTRMLLKSVSWILVPANLKRTIRWHCSHDSIFAAGLETLRHSVFLYISFMFYFKHYCFITFQCVWCFQCVVGGWVFYFLPPLYSSRLKETTHKKKPQPWDPHPLMSYIAGLLQRCSLVFITIISPIYLRLSNQGKARHQVV